MRKESILKKVVAGIGSAALAIALTACAHHDASAEGYGQIRTEAAATTAADSNTAVVATVAAPANANMGGSTTPAVISGPAAVDSDGRAYTSSSAGGTGNASNLGTNTNVNLIPKKTSSEVVVTQSPVVETTTTTVVSNSPAPIEPVIVETPAPTPIVVETPAPVIETPMASSTTEDQTTTTTTTETPKKHRKMHKD
jgi:hypothetical protein